GIKSNLGWEYAMNALEMVSLMKSIQQGPKQSPDSFADSMGVARLPTTPLTPQVAVDSLES
ncbi:MAG: hypothetical protein WA902_17975, partial [Thermosynechococcaceae cyanobacterium]